MQVGTRSTIILNIFGMTWTQHQLGINPTLPLGQCCVPPIVTFYDQQGLLSLRAYLPPNHHGVGHVVLKEIMAYNIDKKTWNMGPNNHIKRGGGGKSSSRDATLQFKKKSGNLTNV